MNMMLYIDCSYSWLTESTYQRLSKWWFQKCW